MLSGTYNPGIFDTQDIEAAKGIILTPELGLTTDERWETETPYLMTLIERLNLDRGSVVLDFGCGIGRLSKAILEKYNCTVIGLDISMNMRAMANIYVNNNNFSSIAPSALHLLGGRIDAVISVWALQHVLSLTNEIDNINFMLKKAGKLFVVNERRRFVPTDKGWMDDSADIFIELQRSFKTDEINVLDGSIVAKDVPSRSFWGVFHK